VEGVGELEVRMQVKGSRIKDINLVGDYFLVGDLDGQLLKPLKGVQLDAESISSALPERLDNIILNLSKEAFIQLILNYKTQ
jgi:lipoic acid synthetase/lipoate-protein ligase A